MRGKVSSGKVKSKSVIAAHSHRYKLPSHSIQIQCLLAPVAPTLSTEHGIRVGGLGTSVPQATDPISISSVTLPLAPSGGARLRGYVVGGRRQIAFGYAQHDDEIPV